MNRLSSTALLLLSLTTMSACSGPGGHDAGSGDLSMSCGLSPCPDGSVGVMDLASTDIAMPPPPDGAVVDFAPPPDLSPPCLAVTPTRDPTNCRATNQPICAAQSCRACRTSTECGMHSLCWSLPADGMGHVPGQCVDATTYVNVNTPSANCAGATGMQASPYCQIQDAINAATAAKTSAVIQVTPSQTGQIYSGLTVPSQGIVIFTPLDARDATTPTRIASLTVSGTGYAVLSDVLVQGGGVNCASTTAMLGLNRTAVLSSSVNGVAADPCSSLVIDSSLIALSGQIGLRVGAAKNYQVTNSVIVQNNQASVTALYGVYLGQASGDMSQVMFAYNTVVDNGVAINASDVGGIFCAGQPTILNSIVGRNQGTQIGSGCTKSGQVVTTTPNFVAGAGSGALIAQRYKLIAGDATDVGCCIDKATGAAIGHDYYQVVRPVAPATKPTVGFAEP